MVPTPTPDGSQAISPTAHYTGYVWARNGLSRPELGTFEGRLLFESLRPTMMPSALLGGGTLETYLIARHRAIDALLERAIEEHDEGAAGLPRSRRGQEPVATLCDGAKGVPPRGLHLRHPHPRASGSSRQSLSPAVVRVRARARLSPFRRSARGRKRAGEGRLRPCQGRERGRFERRRQRPRRLAHAYARGFNCATRSAAHIPNQ